MTSHHLTPRLLRAALVVAAVCIVGRSHGADADAAATPRRPPPLGWRSWNLFEADVDQSLLLAQVDGLTRVRPGNGGKSLRDLGYRSVGLDDGWQVCGPNGYHDKKTGRPLVNTSRFPDMKEMTAYARSKGIDMGWYHNNCRCHGSADVGRESQDAQATVAFGFASVKIDSCGPETNMTVWRAALDAAVAAQSGGPANLSRVAVENCRNYASTENLTKTSACPFDTFRTTEDNAPDFLSVMGNLLTNAAPPGSGAGGQGTGPWGGLPVSHPGCYAYPDMLEIAGSGSCAQDLAPGTCGHESPKRRAGGMNLNESRAHFGAWCIVSSPLILGHDLSNDEAYDAAWPVVSNVEALRINQAWAGDPGRLIQQGGGDMTNITLYHGARCECVWPGQTLPRWTVWAKRLDQQGSSLAVLAINNGDRNVDPESIEVPFTALLGRPAARAHFTTETDVWSGAARAVGAGATSWSLPAALSPHSSYFAVLSR